MDSPAVTWRGAAAVAAAYLALALGYALAIAWQDASAGLARAVAAVLPSTVTDYAIKGVLTVPVWLAVSRLAGRPRAQLVAHAALAPVWVVVWFWTYRALAPVVGYGVLEGGGASWDVFIPGLVYATTFGALHTAATVAERERQAAAEAALAAELERTARRAQVAALRAQMDPHFLFNTLNTVAASVPPELGATRDLVGRLAALVRYTLGASQRDRVPLGDEVAFVRDYLALEGERMGERLRAEVSVDPAALDVWVPPMLLQPLVENAVRHGLAPTVEGGTVWVEIRRAGDALRVRVADDGAGPSRPPADLLAAGLGLANTEARLRALTRHGLELSVPGESPLRRGFEVAFTLPAAGAPTDTPRAKKAAPTPASAL